jgi:toxin ParE1/3/4
MASLRYAVPAIKDLEDIRNYIAEDSKLYANRFIHNLRVRIAELKKMPETGKPIFPDKFENLRQLLFHSCRIIYQYKEDTITIITVHHQSRLIENIPQLKDYKE